MSKIKKIIVAALLLASTIILSRFLSIKTPVLIISFSFVPVILSAILLGPWYTALICGLSDLFGALLFPFGSYFVGYTISSILTGFIYGFILYRKKPYTNLSFIMRLIFSSLLVLVICNGLLNTIWIYITTKKAVFAILPLRIIKQLILLPIQVFGIFFLDLSLRKFYPINKESVPSNNNDFEKSLEDIKEIEMKKIEDMLKRLDQ